MPLKDEHPTDVIAQCIDLLQEAQLTPEGYKIILGGDPPDNVSKSNKLVLSKKCLFLIMALVEAIEHYPTVPWTKLCEHSSTACKKLGYLANETTVHKWWAQFCLQDGFNIPTVNAPLQHPSDSSSLLSCVKILIFTNDS